jgi:hypothetical protein
VKNLHALWDDSAGTDLSDAYVNGLAAKVTAEYPDRGRLSLDPAAWINESFELVKSAVYTFGPDSGTKENPLTLPGEYDESAQKIAHQRIALAGYRLATVLNNLFT